jgi:hypothetical protein
MTTSDNTVETIETSTIDDTLLSGNTDKISTPLPGNMEDDLLLSPPTPSHLNNLLVGGLPSTYTICPLGGRDVLRNIYIYIHTY